MSTVAPVDWQTESLRLSVFPANPDDAISTQYWQTLISTPPDAVRRQPQISQVIEEGPWENVRLQVSGQPGKIDWKTIAAVPIRGGLMVTGPIAGAVPPFRSLMRQWLAKFCSPVTRLAFGASLMLPAPSLSEACLRLNAMLPSVTIDPDGIQDFMYRINRQRRSAHNGLQINGLATWATVQSIGIEIAIGAGAPSARPTQEEYFCRLDLDVNTVPARIPQGKLATVFDELIDAATEIADQGDVP